MSSRWKAVENEVFNADWQRCGGADALAGGTRPRKASFTTNACLAPEGPTFWWVAVFSLGIFTRLRHKKR